MEDAARRGEGRDEQPGIGPKSHRQSALRRAGEHYPIGFWLEYLAACRRLADRNGVNIRTLNKALWEFSKELQR